MASPFLDFWGWLREEVVTIIVGHLVTGGTALASGPDPFRESKAGCQLRVRYYRKHWERMQFRSFVWQTRGIVPPETEGIFSLKFINTQRAIYELYKFPPGDDPLFEQVDHWCNQRFPNDVADYDQAYSFFWLPLNFFSPFELFRQYLYPPYTELGCVIENTRRFQCVSMLIDLLQVEGFSHPWRAPRG